MRRSAGHVAPVRISVLGGSSSSSNSANTTANGPSNQHESVSDKEGDSFPTSKGGGGSSTWNYNEYYNQQQQNQQGQNQPSDGNTEDSPTDDDDWTPVIIRGDPVGCFSAVRQILPLVDRDHDPDIVLEVPIHRAKHNMLVGKGGITIAALSATYETRIMIPPNEFMSNVGGGNNFWKQRQDAGSAMLFGDTSSNHATNNTAAKPAGTLPSNVIQLEGDIDKIEQCLVKMLSIVAGERWIPSGVIVEKAEDTNRRSKSTTNTTSSDGPTPNKAKDETTAEAVIVKIWTPHSKLLNLGKIRKVQRKTNTVIRRKKLRLSTAIIDGSGVPLVNEKEEDVEEEVENDEEEGGKEGSPGDPKTATKYIITGKTESVKMAAAQFEKILGLEPGASTIIDTTHKTNLTNNDGGSNNKDAKPEGESDNGVGPSGKKVRRKKKRGKGGNIPKNSKDGPLQNPVAERVDI